MIIAVKDVYLNPDEVVSVQRKKDALANYYTEITMSSGQPIIIPDDLDWDAETIAKLIQNSSTKSN
jgi:hypothetical protein